MNGRRRGRERRESSTERGSGVYEGEREKDGGRRLWIAIPWALEWDQKDRNLAKTMAYRRGTLADKGKQILRPFLPYVSRMVWQTT